MRKKNTTYFHHQIHSIKIGNTKKHFGKKKNQKIHTSLYLMIPSLYINYRNWLIVVYKTTLSKDRQTKSDDFTQLTTARIFFSF